jgi:hypothetical protein
MTSFSNIALTIHEPACAVLELTDRQQDQITDLLSKHAAERECIGRLAALVAGELGEAVKYFIEGNAGDQQFHRRVYLDKLFRTERAYLALDASYWRRALELTDVLACLPQERRAEWENQIGGWKRGREPHGAPLPPFLESSVRATLADLQARRGLFFGERVEGVFRSLSHTHSTNCPAGFMRRMIIARAITENHTIDYDRAGTINDLRCVIATFMGRQPPSLSQTCEELSNAMENYGTWHQIDDGAVRVRLYRARTAHVEVHPAMAARLNQVLAGLYPNAIANE